MNTDQITKIIIVSCKYLGKALMDIAFELETPISQAPIIDSLELCPPDKYDLFVGDRVMIEVRKKRITGTIDSINGDEITLTNKPLGKTWTVNFTDIIHKHD
jgi:ribosome maturation factor RimP